MTTGYFQNAPSLKRRADIQDRTNIRNVKSQPASITSNSLLHLSSIEDVIASKTAFKESTGPSRHACLPHQRMDSALRRFAKANRFLAEKDLRVQIERRLRLCMFGEKN
jgi:hypothetical protein